MSTFLRYVKRSFILEVKKTIAYPVSFWVVALTIPLYTLIQIVFLETIYGQTTNFVGYTKYEAYILFGTYSIVQTLGHAFLYNSLANLKNLIRGGGQESFDVVLLKPIDPQISATLGKISFGDLVPFIIAIFLVLYGISYEPQILNFFSIFSYIFMIILGLSIFYLTMLFASTFLFWFPELQVTEALWDVTKNYGQYPASLYQGVVGIIFNIIVPLTLMASIPVNFLLGRMPSIMLFGYTGIIFLIFLFTRWFWSTAIKKYSSFSS